MRDFIREDNPILVEIHDITVWFVCLGLLLTICLLIYKVYKHEKGTSFFKEKKGEKTRNLGIVKAIALQLAFLWLVY